jgi:hypothetical protein
MDGGSGPLVPPYAREIGRIGRLGGARGDGESQDYAGKNFHCLVPLEIFVW